MSVKITAKFTCTGCGKTATTTSSRQWGFPMPKGWGTPGHHTRRNDGHYCAGCNKAAKAAVRSALDKRKPKRKR